MAESDLVDALLDGKLSLDLRWRYEYASDDQLFGDQPLRDAHAATLRTALGYRSRAWHGFGFAVEGEGVITTGLDRYFDGSNNRRDTAAIIDPAGLELNQGYAYYNGLAGTSLRLGRQVITYRRAPLHRHVGTVEWRQNWQTFDAVAVETSRLGPVLARYAYVWGVERIFGNEGIGALDRFDSDSHLLNLKATLSVDDLLEAYAYRLRFDNAPASSHDTVGFRVEHLPALTSGFSWTGEVELAYQDAAAANPLEGSAWLHNTLLGLRWRPRDARFNLGLRAGLERQTSDDGFAFTTPLGTNHAFQGFADRFLVTPAAGLSDINLGASLGLRRNARASVRWHQFESSDFGFRYGTELDAQVTVKLNDAIEVGAKYGDYRADRGRRNTVGEPAADATRVWFWLQRSY